MKARRGLWHSQGKVFRLTKTSFAHKQKITYGLLQVEFVYRIQYLLLRVHCVIIVHVDIYEMSEYITLQSFLTYPANIIIQVTFAEA